jgi:uncharacterized membrane protein YgdD (TMEM256/DUF423 family)
MMALTHQRKSLMDARMTLVLGALLAGLGVAAGAFGAHWLKGELARRGLSLAEQHDQLAVWDVAVRYQMYHALGLLALGLWGSQVASGPLRWASVLFVVGVVIFSGCLYALVLSGVKILGAIVPLGGTAMIVGWVFVAVAAWRGPSP